MSLDLSDVPALVQPTPPSNTLLITVCDAAETYEKLQADLFPESQ